MTGILAIQLSLVAEAAPVFVGSPSDIAVAASAWAAATECAGWEAAAHDVVTISSLPQSSTLGGRAERDRSGLHSIMTSSTEHRTHTLVHEVAHAWVWRREQMPKALSEGLAELLTECIFKRSPHLEFVPRDEWPRSATERVDLLAWDHGGVIDSSLDLARYNAAIRLMRTANQIVPATDLWRDTPGLKDWPWFWGLLVVHGPIGDDHWAALTEVGPHADRLDIDGDGLSVADELDLGLDPWRWDTDGDGWWDGAQPVFGAASVPLDGSSHCSGWRAGRRGATVEMKVEGPMVADVEVELIAHQESLGSTAGAVTIPAGEAIGISATLTTPEMPNGGVWVRLTGRGLKSDKECRR